MSFQQNKLVLEILIQIKSLTMKKLIAVITLLFAFSINANAQDKKITSGAEKAKKETLELTQFLNLNETESDNFFRLFENKYRTLEQSDLSAERKVELSRIIEAKIRATLDEKQMDKLDKNPELLKKLIN